MINRRRQIPWIQRWSRPITAVLALIGAFGTAYLTYEKFVGARVACPTSGCERVLSSPYATVFGVPLTVFGFLGYVAMGLMAIAPFLINPETQKPLRRTVESLTQYGLLLGGTAMAVFSGYLMYLLAAVLKTLCIYCITSATFSFTFLVLAFVGYAWEDIGQILFTSAIVALVTIVGTLGVYANVNNPGGSGNQVETPGEAGPPVVNISGQSEIALAEYLTSIDAKMYGAYWCPHCHDQKELFGSQAFRKIKYVECAPEGKNSQAQLCQEQKANITGFPTWEIKGKFYGGTRSLTELADLAGYTGPRNFKVAAP